MLVSRGWVGILVLPAVLVLIGNAKSWLLPGSQAGSVGGVALGLVLAAGAVLYAWRVLHLTNQELGLSSWKATASSIGWAFLAIGAPTLAVALAWRILAGFGVHLDPPLAPGDLSLLAPEVLQRRILVYLPFDTVLPEELVFRALLLAELQRRLGALGPAVLISMIAFTGWHLTIGIQESGGNLGLLGLKLLAYFGGSLLLTLPLLTTGNVLGCMVAHWLADALLMTVGNPTGQGLRAVLLG